VLEKEFPGKVTVQSLDASSPEAAEMTKRLGFKEHGLVIRSSRGAVLWKATDHKLKMDEVREQLRTQLAYQEAT
jgi:cysteine synthase